MSSKYVFGIDLGTTNSALACYTGGIPETVLVQGGRTIPSVVWFHPDGTTTVGSAAYARKGQPDVVYSSKRDMGTDTVYHLTLSDGSTKDVTPIDVAAEVLKAIVRDADPMYGKVEEAVVTVPAYFNDKQRTATRKAVELAGIKLINMINEPTAAALAYGVNKTDNCSEVVIVTDIGGGTTDITLMCISNFKTEDDIPLSLQGVIKPGLTFDVLSTGGNNRLGGDDYDEFIITDTKKRLIREYSEKEKKEHTGDDSKFIRENFSVAKYKHLVELWKKMEDSVAMNVTCTAGSDKRIYSICDEDKLTGFIEFWKRIDSCIEDTMNVYETNVDTGVKEFVGRYSDPSICIPVGGSTKNPLLLKALEQKFSKSGMTIPNALFADEAIALGAAINAAITKGIESRITLKEINPLPIGIETVSERNGKQVDGVFAPIIPKDVTIPIRRIVEYSTSFDNQTEIVVKVYQGLSSFVANNQFLGTFSVPDLPAKPAEEVVIQLIFEVDINGQLSVTATYEGESKQVKFNSVLNSATREYSRADENNMKYLLSVKDYMESIGYVDNEDYSAVSNWVPGNPFPKYAIEHRKEITKFVQEKIRASMTSMFTTVEEE